MTTATATPLVDINTLASWDELCEAGRIVGMEMDARRWYQGALANRVVYLFVRHPDDENAIYKTLKEFAKETGTPYKTIAQRRQMEAFYPLSTRENFLKAHPNINYTHLRHAMRLGDVNLAYAFLTTASREGWTADQTGYEIGKLLNDGDGDGSDKTRKESVTVPIRYNEHTNEITFRLEFAPKTPLLSGGVYKITIEKA